MIVDVSLSCSLLNVLYSLLEIQEYVRWHFLIRRPELESQNPKMTKSKQSVAAVTRHLESHDPWFSSSLSGSHKSVHLVHSPVRVPRVHAP